MTRNAATVMLGAWLLTTSLPARAAAIVNGSFEDEVRSADTFCITIADPLCPAITGWTGAFYLVNGTPGPITPPTPVPDGSQIVMVQNTNAIQQSIPIDVAGNHQLSWWDAGRAAFIGAGGNESYDVSLDGEVLGSFSTTTGSAWAFHSLIFAAEAGVFTLEILGTTPFGNGDHSVLLDDFVLEPAPEPTALAANAAALALLVCLRRGATRR